MTTAADVMPGQSGSPMFGFWSDGPYVVAVASGVGNIFSPATRTGVPRVPTCRAS